MSLSQGLLDGMVLAATIQDDAGGERALPGLADGLARALRERTEALAESDSTTRRSAIRDITGRLRAVAQSAQLPTRARAILAPEMPRAIGRKWASQAPPVRRGFRVAPALRATLRRLATPTDPAAHAEELSFAEHADRRLRPWAERLAQEENQDPARVLGALGLGAQPKSRPCGDAPTDQPVRGQYGDQNSNRWRQIGAELAMVWESAWRA